MQKLPTDVQLLLCASIQLSTYRRAVEELVYNAIDADSTSIAIRINIEEQTIQVIDNGCGISKDDFKLLGQRNTTSKYVDLSTLKSAPNKYGFRGQALSSIIEVSQSVKITSRHQNSTDTWVNSFKRGKEEKLSETSHRPSKGTTVEIKGFFYNLKIQRKSVDPLTELNNIKVFLEQLSLVHTNVSLSLRDDSKNEIIFQLHKNRDIYQTLSSMFSINKTDLQEFTVEKNAYKVRAYFGKRDIEINSQHWIFLNGKLLQNSKVHKIVDDSLIKILNINARGKTRVKSKKLYNNEDENRNESKIPTYFIFLTCPFSDYDLSSATKSTVEFKNWEQITKLLEKLVKFYSGDVNVKELKPITNQDNKMKLDDKRDQVKKIMEKILGSYPKKIGVSQMQKGVKGKLIKRKLKNENGNDNKMESNHNNNTMEPNITQQQTCSNNIIREDNKTFAKSTNKGNKVQNILKSKRVHSKNNDKEKSLKNRALPKKKQNLSKIATTYTIDMNKKKKNDKNKKYNVTNSNRTIKKIVSKPRIDPLVKRFKDDPTRSVKKRCDILANKVEHLMRYKQKRKRKIYVNETVQYSNVIRNNKKYSIRKKIDEIVIHNYIPQPPKLYLDDGAMREKESMKPCKSSYDLIKTVLRTQETAIDSQKHDFSHATIRHDSPLYEIRKPIETANETSDLNDILADDVPHNYTLVDVPMPIETVDLNTRPNNYSEPSPGTYSVAPITFESHDYNMHYINKISHEYNFNNNNDDENQNKKNKSRQFISTTSRENFIVPLRKKFKSDFGYHFTKSKPHYNKKKLTNTFKNFKKMASQESSYLIEFSQSNRNELRKENQNRSYQRNIVWDTCSQPRNSNNKFETYTIEQHTSDMISSEVGCTYTILHNVSPEIKDIEEQCDYNKDIVIENHVNKDKTITTEYNESEEQIREVNDNIVFVSKSQEQEQHFKEILPDHNYPVDVCETIYNHDDRKPNDTLFDEDFYVDSLICDRNEYTQRNPCEIPETEDAVSINEMEKAIDDLHQRDLDFWNNTQKRCNNMDDNDDVHRKGVQDSMFNFRNRPRFMPKGMSQIFSKCQTKNACDYNLETNYYEENLYSNFAENVQTNAEIFEPGVQNVKELTTKAIEKVNNKVSKDNASLIFESESLKQAKVLRQIDNKFIAAKILGKSHQGAGKLEYLVLFDQHAVHERIRLEFNLSTYFNGDQWKSNTLDEAITIKLSKDEIIYLHNYKDKFEVFGLKWTILETGDVSVTVIPEAILGKNPRQVDVIMKAVKNVIAEEIKAIKVQSGCISLYPKALMDLVFSEACRYAIKFGDKLSMNDCVDLVHSLADCKTPFQCAHGRPVMAVLMDVKDNEERYKINFSKLEQWTKGRREK